MKKKFLIKEYSKTAFEWDKWYAELHNIVINESIRVEQGEYAVVNCDQKLGTYNVRQCVAVYLATKKMHGLAHVDGHTEIKSLKAYIDALNITEENPLTNIRIIGASSDMVMGLNNSKENIRKITPFLEGLLNKDYVKELIEKKDSYINFTIEYPDIIHNKSLPMGSYDKEQALHTIQEIKRIDKYSGTYPIIRANDGHSKSVFLDERAIKKLAEYIKNIDKDKIRSKWDTNNYKAFDEAVPIILEEWKKSAGSILNVSKVFTISPLFVGEDSIKFNKEGLLQYKTYANSANIDTVLNYCHSIDDNLDTIKIKNILKDQYKESFDYGILEYDAVINANKLLTMICNHSSLLNKLMMLNSQGASDLNGNRYKIQDIKAILDKEECLILGKIIENCNTELSIIGENPINEEQYNQFINMQFQSREKPLSRKQKMSLTHGNKDAGSYIQDFCKESKFDFNQVNQSIEKKLKDYKNIQINKNKITDQSDFYCIQSEFLKALKLPNFSDVSIGMYLSEHADNFSYVCDVIFGGKISAIIYDFNYYFYNKMEEEFIIEPIIDYIFYEGKTVLCKYKYIDHDYVEVEITGQEGKIFSYSTGGIGD